MHCAWTKFLAVLPAILAVASAGESTASKYGASPTKLRPIKLNDRAATSSIGRRATENFSALDLQTQSNLIYGTPGEHGQAVLANMTLYAPDGLQMIMMERFEGYTSAVDCKGDDGTMSLTFKSQKAYDYALKTWSFVNKKEDDQFLLIANHDGCGPDDERQPYLITKVTEDTAHLTTFLSAQPAPWSDVAGTYDLDFGHTGPPKSQKTKKRGFFDGIGDALTGNWDVDKTVTVNTNGGTPGEVSNIYTDSKGRFTLDCVNCFIQGSFSVSGHLKVHHFSLEDLSLSANPNNFIAELEMKASVKATAEPVDLQYSKTLFEFPIPDAGIEVPGIFKLGAILSYDVGVGTTFTGTATVDFGLKVELPNEAKLVADISNPDSSTADGFSGALTPIFDLQELSASTTIRAFSQPKLTFGLDITKVGHADVALILKLPQVSATFTAEYNQNGVCSQDANALKTGVKLSSEVDFEVDVAIEAGFGDNNGKPLLNKKLFSWTHPLYDHCFPINIPGLNPAAASSAPLSLPAPGTAPLGTGAATLSTLFPPYPLSTGGTAYPTKIPTLTPVGTVPPSGGLPGPTAGPSSGLPGGPHNSTVVRRHPYMIRNL